MKERGAPGRGVKSGFASCGPSVTISGFSDGVNSRPRELLKAPEYYREIDAALR